MACEPLSIQPGLSVAATSYAVCMDSPLALRDEHQQFLWRVVAVLCLHWVSALSCVMLGSTLACMMQIAHNLTQVVRHWPFGLHISAAHPQPSSFQISSFFCDNKGFCHQLGQF